MRNLGKVIQRRVYSFLNTTWGIALFVVLLWLLVVTLLSSGQRDPCRLQGRGDSPLYCSTRNFRDNIALRPSEAFTAYEPIDVVYTWVNGSDPVWLAKKALWTKKHSTNNNNNNNSNNENNNISDSNENNNNQINSDNSTNNSVTNATAINGNSTNHASNQTLADTERESESESESESDNEDETMSSNRYRDSEELRYSLRSLVKNAPWIRHIYLVTDNQLPHWLNLETDRLSVVTHEEIFANKSHLPVFSSPAIEANLHRIPGLSRRFIYFNDDVFLGAPVLPDDFLSLTGAQKLVMAWEVPKCAPGCSDSWIGDGFCDRACNVSACNWDFPDCVNSSNSYGGVNGNFYSQSSAKTSSVSVYCTTGCPDGWLADKVCDQRCKNEECGWDFGDCGSDLVTNTLPGVELSRENARLSSDSEGERDGERDEYESYLAQQREFLSSSHYYAGFDENELSQTRTETESHPTHTHTLPSALSVPFGTKAVYFNLSVLPCRLHFNEHTVENNNNNNSNSNHTQLLTSLSSHICVARNISSFKFTSAEHDDENNEIVHHAAVVSQLHTLVVTLYHGQENAPRPVAFPMNVRFTVFGFDEETSATASLSFSLTVTKPLSKHALLAHMPTDMGEITDAVSAVHVDTHVLGLTHTNTHRTEATTVKVLRVPTNEILLRSPSPNLTHIPTLSRHEGIVLHWFAPANNNLSLFENNAFFAPERLSALITVSLRNDSVFSMRAPLCALLAEFSEISEALTDTHSEEHSTARFFTNAHRFCDDSFSSYSHLSHSTERGSARSNRSSATNMRGAMTTPSHTTRANNGNGAQTTHLTARNISRAVMLADLYQRQFVSSSLATLIATREGPNEMALLKERRKQASNGVNIGAGVLLVVPLPLRFALSERDFVHLKIEVLSSASSIPASSSAPKETENDMQWRHRVGAFASSSSHHNIAEHEKRVMYISALLRWGTNRTVINAETGSTQNVTNYSNDTSIVGNNMNTLNASLLTLTNTSELFALLPIVNSGSNETSLTTTNTSVSIEETRSGQSSVSLEDTERTVSDAIASPEKGNKNETLHTNSSDSAFASVPLQDTNETTVDDVMSSLTRRRLSSDNYFSLSSLLSSVRLYFARAVANLAGIEFLPTLATSAQPRRRLIDTYAQSLIFVNRMYNKEFGVENRRVPAHVPHMIDREVMDEMQSGKWATHWRETSSHRFRSAQDMQYSFAYYHYLVHRHKLLEKDFASLLAQVADTDGDGFLNDNELRTLAAMSLHRTVQAADVQEIIDCIAANSSFVPHLSGAVEYSSKPGKLTKSLQIRRFPTVAQAANCSLIRERLTEKVDWSTRLSPAPSLLSDKDLVAFEMLGDNATEVLHQLDSIRARQSKFVCVNDNMKNPTKEGEEALRTFFEAFFPFPSDFELPPGQRNPTLYVDEYRALREQQSFRVERMQRAMREYMHELLQPLRESAREAARRVIEALDEDGVYSLGQDEREVDREIMRKMERDLLYNPLHRVRETKKHREKESVTETEREAAALARFVLFLSVCAVIAIIVLRRCVISERESSRERETHTAEPVRVWSEAAERQRREEMAHSIQSEYEQIQREARQEIYDLQREQDDRQEDEKQEEEADERIDEERLTRRRIWGEQEEMRDFFEREQYDDLLRLSALQEEDSNEPPLWQRLPAHTVKKMR